LFLSAKWRKLFTAPIIIGKYWEKSNIYFNTIN
jgi:hypothetical protein